MRCAANPPNARPAAFQPFLPNRVFSAATWQNVLGIAGGPQPGIGSPLLRKFLKIALLVCLAIAAIPAAMSVMIGLWIWRVQAEPDNFYRDHPLLGEMRAVEKQSTNNSVAAREAFLKIAPPGTEKQAMIAMLRKETLNCQGDIGPLLTCQTMSPGGLGQLQWILCVDFDADGRLSDARIAIWSIFL